MVGGMCFQANPSECVMMEEISMKGPERGSMREQRKTGQYSTWVFLRSVTLNTTVQVQLFSLS